jgi:anhydro-N-acetylmuramic acid kinase
MGVVLAAGMMSGTSLDGVDCALIETDGHRIAGFGPSGYRPYSDPERALLRQALAEAASLTDRNARPGILGQAEALVTSAHAEAFETLLTANAVARSDIAIVGFHGQTVLHRPAQSLTVQIGNGSELARRIGVSVAYDFRAADVAAGGQGAPLVPIFHCALVDMVGDEEPVMVVNIGGVANVTFCEKGQPPIACDTGPGNALIDDFLRTRTGEAFDAGGAIAAGGRIEQPFVARALTRPFFNLPPPKSLDRNDFAKLVPELAHSSVADGVATLTMLTAASIARIVPHLPRPPRRVIVAGGGTKNHTLMAMLSELMVPAATVSATILGWSADALEAQAFAYLAVRTERGLPITFPSTTGVRQPMLGGIIAKP